MAPSVENLIWKELQDFAHTRSDAYAEIRDKWTACAFADDASAVAALCEVVARRVGVSPRITTAIATRMLRPRQYQRLLHEAPDGGPPYFTDRHGRSSVWRHRNDRAGGAA